MLVCWFITGLGYRGSRILGYYGFPSIKVAGAKNERSALCNFKAQTSAKAFDIVRSQIYLHRSIKDPLHI